MAPLVADMSSDILSRPVDVSRFALIYAGAQKNIGPAGLTVVVVRKDLLGNARPGTPSMLDYAVHAEADSMSNTPPTYAWYLAGLVFEWLKAELPEDIFEIWSIASHTCRWSDQPESLMYVSHCKAARVKLAPKRGNIMWLRSTCTDKYFS